MNGKKYINKYIYIHRVRLIKNVILEFWFD